MAYSFTGSEEELSEIFFRGISADFRKTLKYKLMENMEKDVDAALDKLLDGMQAFMDTELNMQSGDRIIRIQFKDQSKERCI